MTTIFENQIIEDISLADLDKMDLQEADVLLETVESNTEWKDAEKNMMRNGAKMFGC